MQYTPQQFTEAIQRELAKRATTYPKIIDKKRKRIISEMIARDEYLHDAEHAAMMQTMDDVVKQKIQYELLEAVLNFMELGNNHASGFEKAMMDELNRELKMRKRVYPRFVYFKRIKPEIAEQEIAIWAALCEYFKENYSQCTGDCGMNYCDENGCTERKRILCNPAPATT